MPALDVDLRGAWMYEVHTADTPNGVKVPIALEELGLPYRIVHVDLRAGAQRDAAFLALNPNGRIPVLVDPGAPGGPLCIAESGAILLHLAGLGGGLLPACRRAQVPVLEWLFLQASSIGPVFGTVRALACRRDDDPVVARFRGEARRLLDRVECTLADRPWLAGERYSVADIACYGWLRSSEYCAVEAAPRPAIQCWVERIDARPAVGRALAALRAAAAHAG